jgi:hypothetical protein
VANQAAKNKKMKYTVAFGRLPINNGSNNNPTKNRHPQWRGVWRGCAPVGRHGGKHDTIILGALEVGKLIKNEYIIEFNNYFFSRPCNKTMLNLSAPPSNEPFQSSFRGWGELIHQSHVAIAANGSPWWWCVLDV